MKIGDVEIPQGIARQTSLGTEGSIERGSSVPSEIQPLRSSEVRDNAGCVDLFDPRSDGGVKVAGTIESGREGSSDARAGSRPTLTTEAKVLALSCTCDDRQDAVRSDAGCDAVIEVRQHRITSRIGGQAVDLTERRVDGRFAVPSENEVSACEGRDDLRGQDRG